MERNSLYVKQMWVKKDELISMIKKMGPNWIWVPKTNAWLFCRLKWEETTNYGSWIVVARGTWLEIDQTASHL